MFRSPKLRIWLRNGKSKGRYSMRASAKPVSYSPVKSGEIQSYARRDLLLRPDLPVDQDPNLLSLEMLRPIYYFFKKEQKKNRTRRR